MKQRSQVKRLTDADIMARALPGVRENLREIERLADVMLAGTHPLAPIAANINGIASATANLLSHLDPENDAS